MEDVLQQLLAPPMLEALTAMLVGTAASATGMNVFPKSVADANFPLGVPFVALMFTVCWLLFQIIIAGGATVYSDAKALALAKARAAMGRKAPLPNKAE